MGVAHRNEPVVVTGSFFAIASDGLQPTVDKNGCWFRAGSLDPGTGDEALGKFNHRAYFDNVRLTE
jgi:hypothetical protein